MKKLFALLIILSISLFSSTASCDDDCCADHGGLCTEKTYNTPSYGKIGLDRYK